MLSGVIKGFATQILQHLLAQNSWANAILQPFAGKSVQFKIAMVKSSVLILEDGSLGIAGDTNTPDAIVTIPASVLPRLLAKDAAAKMQIDVEGDTHLASELAKVLGNMRWDYAEDLSRVIGDVPAHKATQFVAQTSSAIKQTSINLAEMLSEYWQEEKPMIAKKHAVEKFNAEVDSLRADTARLEKRLNKLLQNVSVKNR